MGHAERHAEHVRSAKSDAIRSETIYRSDGSDGYSEGTFGYVVSRGGWSTPVDTWGDGGYPSRGLAAEAARKVGDLEV
jgi:hypothetical protein